MENPSTPVGEVPQEPSRTEKKAKACKKKRCSRDACRSRAKGKEFKAGSNRGIETMLRSAYRTHLDLTSLADNKASIMITINGLIISILLATGGSVVAFADNNLYILPIIVLLISGFISMIYAVFSARPIAARCCDAEKVPEDFLNGKANVMYFMDNADLSNEEYVEVMKAVMEDKNKVYEEMVSYIHTMSVIIRRKFFLLRTSYTVFIVGLGLCIATFIGVAGVIMLKAEEPSEVVRRLLDEPARFSRFPLSSGIYEPSGVHQLRDGRVLVVEDEVNQPFTLLTFGSGGVVGSTRLLPAEQFDKKGPFREFRKLDDLEGVAVDPSDRVYAVTSHSVTEKGETGKNRSKLVRFTIVGDEIAEPVVVNGLEAALADNFPVLRRAVAERTLNIEALSLNESGERLLLGFRAPLDHQGNALVAVLEDLDGLFSERPEFRFKPALIHLDLGGDAIRGMSYDPRLRGYLIVAGSSEKGSGRENRVWFWRGDSGAVPRPVVVDGRTGVANGEGIAPVRIGGEDRILIVSDDGDRRRGSNAHFLLVDYDRLQLSIRQ